MRTHTTLSLTAAALFAGAAVLGACASGGGAGTGDTGPGAERRFYEARCGVCHVPFHKGDFAPRHWPAILDLMGPRAGLSTAQRERVLRYLTAPEPAPAPEPAAAPLTPQPPQGS